MITNIEERLKVEIQSWEREFRNLKEPKIG